MAGMWRRLAEREGRKGLGYRWMSGGRQGIKEGRWSQGGAGQGTGGGVKVKTAV